jgi:hypothetical protein
MLLPIFQKQIVVDTSGRVKTLGRTIYQGYREILGYQRTAVYCGVADRVSADFRSNFEVFGDRSFN